MFGPSLVRFQPNWSHKPTTIGSVFGPWFQPNRSHKQPTTTGSVFSPSLIRFQPNRSYKKSTTTSSVFGPSLVRFQPNRNYKKITTTDSVFGSGLVCFQSNWSHKPIITGSCYCARWKLKKPTYAKYKSKSGQEAQLWIEVGCQNTYSSKRQV